MAVARKLQHSRLKGASAHQPGWSWEDIEDPQSSGLPNWSIQSVDREKKKRTRRCGHGEVQSTRRKEKGGRGEMEEENPGDQRSSRVGRFPRWQPTTECQTI